MRHCLSFTEAINVISQTKSQVNIPSVMKTCDSRRNPCFTTSNTQRENKSFLINFMVSQFPFFPGTIGILSAQPELWPQPGVHLYQLSTILQEAASIATDWCPWWGIPISKWASWIDDDTPWHLVSTLQMCFTCWATSHAVPQSYPHGRLLEQELSRFFENLL